jgi:uncharacterized membrane protein
MRKGLSLLGAAGVGAGLMYLFDPHRGNKRRALIADKVTHAKKVAGEVVDKTGRDVRNHLLGAISEMQAVFRTTEVSDDVLKARVRAKLGHVCSHPSAIEVKAERGLIVLGGPILSKEEHPVLNAVAHIDGVTNLVNLLELHDDAGDLPALQGGRQKEAQRIRFLKTNWSPTMRLAASIAGGALAVYGVKRRGLFGSVISSVGFGIVTRAVTNVETSALVGLDAERKPIEIQKTINIEAPVDLVFEYWSHPENFSQFMSHVHEVTRIGDGVYRWTVGGPAGLLVRWDASITEIDFNKQLAWKSLPGSIMRQQGVTKFTSNPNGGTCIDVKMSYTPPVGVLGHKIAELLGADPKHEMDEDLMRMKSFIETGRVPHDAWSHLHLPQLEGGRGLVK